MSKEVASSFDILKTIAIFTLIIDHFGYFFYNDIEIFRVIGRLGYLLYIFCYGYKQKYHFDATLIVLTILMVLNNIIIAPAKFIFSEILDNFILCSVIITQIFMFYCAERVKEETAFAWLILLEILAIPTKNIFQFGTEGIIIAICGSLCARFKHSAIIPIFMAISLITYAAIESVDRHFKFSSIILLGVIFLFIWAILRRFSDHPLTTHRYVARVTKWISNYSLLLFFVHYELFMIIHWLYP